MRSVTCGAGKRAACDDTGVGKVTEQRFRQGQTYTEWKAAMTRNREQVETNEKRAALTAEQLAPFRTRPLHVMALAADWCGDVVANLPVLARIAAQAPGIDLRIFDRDQNADLMDQYLNQGQFRSIPVFAFFNEQWRELGAFIERPASVTELRGRKRAEIFAAHPEFGPPDGAVDQLADDVRARLQDELRRMRDETTDWANSEVVRELTAIVQKR